MARAAFVERKLTARRGRRRAVVLVRVFKPVRDPRGGWNCEYELLVDGKRSDKRGKATGEDGLQSFLLVFTVVPVLLERFEIDTGFTIEAWQLDDIRRLAQANKRAARRSSRERVAAKSARTR